MTLSALILSVLVALPHPPPEAHARALSEAIATAAHDAPLWATGDGGETPDAIPAGEAATAAVLVGIGFHESGFLERLARCQYRGAEGDHGRSLGTWQLQGRLSWGPYTRVEICDSDALQAERAVEVLQIHRRRGVSLDGMLRAFASGNAATYTRAGRELAGNVASACRRFGLTCGVVPRWVKGPPS